jgi:hypothetical protein
MDNKKQPKPQDDSGQTLEERVDEFMAPVESSDSMPTSDTKPPQKIGNKIKVIHADDEAESTPPAATAPADEPAPTAPLVPASTPKKKSIAVSIAGADEVEAAPAPPPKPKPTKKVIAISDEGDLATIPEEVTPIVPELETSTVVSDEQLEANPDDSEDGDKVISGDKGKFLEMEFVRNVEKEQITEAWSEAVFKGCIVDCDAYKGPLKEFNSLMGEMRKGQRMSLAFYPDRLEVDQKGRNPKKGSITSKSFAKNLLAIFIGPKMFSQEVKNSLLGKK